MSFLVDYDNKIPSVFNLSRCRMTRPNIPAGIISDFTKTTNKKAVLVPGKQLVPSTNWFFRCLDKRKRKTLGSKSRERERSSHPQQNISIALRLETVSYCPSSCLAIDLLYYNRSRNESRRWRPWSKPEYPTVLRSATTSTSDPHPFLQSSGRRWTKQGQTEKTVIS